jgi:uncharacterized protein YycO
MKDLCELPAASIGLCRSEYNILSWAIRCLTKGWSSHALIYFGSGKHETVEAEAKGVCIDTLDSRLNKKNSIEFYHNKNLTGEQLGEIKVYAYARVGAGYDYQGIGKFFERIAFSWFGIARKTSDDPNRFFCSELAVNAYNVANLRISDKIASESSPNDLKAYFDSETGFSNGWRLWDKWNC